MKTLYRDEQNKLQRAVIEELYKYHYIHQELFINGIAYTVEKISIDEKTQLRIVRIRKVDGIKSFIEYRSRRGDYEVVKKIE